MKIILIRHAQTQGNLEKRYIGKTDEPLCAEGIKTAQALFESGNLSHADLLISSPYLRCTETAKILYPGKPCEIYEGFRECDFGEFEEKTYEELRKKKEYIAWIENNCLGDIPKGENVADFKYRCCNAFFEAVKDRPDDITIAFVIHGGSIMAILEHFSHAKKSFYDYHIKNCEFVVCIYDGKFLE